MERNILNSIIKINELITHRKKIKLYIKKQMRFEIELFDITVETYLRPHKIKYFTAEKREIGISIIIKTSL